MGLVDKGEWRRGEVVNWEGERGMGAGDVDQTSSRKRRAKRNTR